MALDKKEYLALQHLRIAAYYQTSEMDNYEFANTLSESTNHYYHY
jgi:hypothetical protein